jgi:glycosyltransferase involved in cell wall biosynthesis
MAGHNENGGLRVLVLEPYYGGSHRAFLSGLARLPFEFEVMALPARKWKWRMRLAAPYFARKLHESGRRFDRILCSTFIDVAAFRGLAPPWGREVPLLTYFHENQFAYPVQVETERDMHFALTNMTTALASDSLAFNSSYNLSSFLDGIEDLLKYSDDLRLEDPCGAIRAKSRVLPPGVDFSAIDAEEEPRHEGAPVILWNHRWEHDKNPELFFEALFGLDREGVDFGLVVLGEAFERRPAIFEEAEKRLSHRTLHFGYAKSRREYARWLRRGDLAVSTAWHEFFGIAVIEAVRAGCRPLLPRRLSYPELFRAEFLYDDEDFARRLKEEVLDGMRLAPGQAGELTGQFSWEALATSYTSWIRDARVL